MKNPLRFDGELEETGEVDGSAVDPGIGSWFNAPMGESGLHLFGSKRVSTISLDYPGDDTPGHAVQWSYDGGLGYAMAVEFGFRQMF